MARVLNTQSELAGVAVQVSDHSLKRVSLTGLAESDVSAAGGTTELADIIVADTNFVKVNDERIRKTPQAA